MLLTKRSLALPAEPPSVRLARAWVADVLTEVGRADLVHTAQLGVSELVTNAILHARPPLTISVRGTARHPRIEVLDHSPNALHPATLAAVTDDCPTTYGRGLALVAMNAAQWGSEADADGVGKRVWFEPAPEMHEGADLFDVYLGPPLDEPSVAVPPPEDSVSVVLLNLPARLFGELRRYHFELRRELRLLLFSDRDRFPIAAEITEIFSAADAERRAASGINRLDEAIERGRSTVDLEYAVPASTPHTMRRLQQVLEEVYRVFADEHLLAMAPREPLRELQHWYFNEFVRQGRGEAPRPWHGAVDHVEPARVYSVS